MLLLVIFLGEQVKEVVAERSLELQRLRFEPALILQVGARDQARQVVVVAQGRLVPAHSICLPWGLSFA